MNPEFFAGHRAALLSLDAAIRVIASLAPPPIQEWESELFSLAVGTNERHVPLNDSYTPVLKAEVAGV